MEVKAMDFTEKIVLKGQYQKKEKKLISPKKWTINNKMHRGIMEALGTRARDITRGNIKDI